MIWHTYHFSSVFRASLVLSSNLCGLFAHPSIPGRHKSVVIISTVRSYHIVPINTFQFLVMSWCFVWDRRSGKPSSVPPGKAPACCGKDGNASGYGSAANELVPSGIILCISLISGQCVEQTKNNWLKRTARLKYMPSTDVLPNCDNHCKLPIVLDRLTWGGFRVGMTHSECRI